MRRHTLLLALATLAAAALAGCGGGSDDQGAAGSGGSSATTAAGSDTVDWPLFGRVEQRTHYIANAPDPPFHMLWEFFARQLIEFPPLLQDGFVIVINKTGDLFVIEAQSGKVRRRSNLGNDVTSPAYADGVVYAAQLDGSLIALEVPGLNPRWKFQASSKLESSPLVVDDKVFLGSDNGTFYALDAETGKLAWSTRLGHQVKASPSYDDGTVYVGDYEGTVWALDAQTGKRRWNTDTTSLPPGGNGGFYSSPSVAFGHVYEARTDGTVYALEARHRQAGLAVSDLELDLQLSRGGPGAGHTAERLRRQLRPSALRARRGHRQEAVGLQRGRGGAGDADRGRKDGLHLKLPEQEDVRGRREHRQAGVRVGLGRVHPRRVRRGARLSHRLSDGLGLRRQGRRRIHGPQPDRAGPDAQAPG